MMALMVPLCDALRDVERTSRSVSLQFVQSITFLQQMVI